MTKWNKAWVSRDGVKRLQAIKRRILANPKAYRQDRWHCGTAMCIAGHAALMANKDIRAVEAKRDWDDNPIFCPKRVGSTRAMPEDAWQRLGLKALGLKLEHPWATHRLFDLPHNWPDPFSRRFMGANSYKRRAQVACARIDHFIETGE